jgi:DNA-binding CsgD family transcriptional regulator
MAERLPQGVVGVSGDARVQWANSAAERVFRERDGLTVDRGSLLAAAACVTTRLRAAVLGTVANALEECPQSLALPRPSQRRPYAAVVLAVPQESGLDFEPQMTVRALVIVADPEHTPPTPFDLLASQYDLTPTEARVADLIGRGRSVDELCAEMQISSNTARTHLKRVYLKTGTSRQAELVGLLVGRLGTVLVARPAAL